MPLSTEKYIKRKINVSQNQPINDQHRVLDLKKKKSLFTNPHKYIPISVFSFFLSSKFERKYSGNRKNKTVTMDLKSKTKNCTFLLNVLIRMRQ